MPTNGDRANPDWIHCCFSCELRSVQDRVLCKKLVISFRNSCTTSSAAEESSESYSESGKRLQRRVHSLQLKIEGCAELKTTTSPALSSECGSVTSRTPCLLDFNSASVIFAPGCYHIHEHLSPRHWYVLTIKTHNWLDMCILQGCILEQRS